MLVCPICSPRFFFAKNGKHVPNVNAGETNRRLQSEMKWSPSLAFAIGGGRFSKMGSWQNDDSVIRRVLETSKTIALVGASKNVERASNHVMADLQRMGYRVIPTNPGLAKQNVELYGERVYPNLEAAFADHEIDLVDVFRRSEDAGEFVDEAIKFGAKAVWLQMGVVDEEAGKRAVSAGLDVVMDSCPLPESRRLGISGPST